MRPFRIGFLWAAALCALSFYGTVGRAADETAVAGVARRSSTERVFEEVDRYLHLPVKVGAPKVWIELHADGQRVRRFQISLARGDADFVAAADVQPWQGKTLRVVAPEAGDADQLLEQISSHIHLPDAATIGHEPYRPAFHFTSNIGWLNDPNGLVHHDGVWHLFYQHNPFGWHWGNMHWGHATSADLIHWIEQGEAIHPWSDAVGAAFSGSGVVDHHNSSGLREGEGDLLVFAFTDTEAGESLAYSNDGGHTLQLYESNPVVKHQGRDPKIIWHEPTRRWVMAVYSVVEEEDSIAFYTSADLKTWEYQSRIAGFYECPDLFELPVSNAPGRSQWVLYAADGKYLIGDFDGRQFRPADDQKHQVWYGNFYAGQTYSNAPGGRRIQMGWARGIEFPGARFNQQMVVPVELRLQKTSEGIRMFADPVRELNAYRRLLATVDEVEVTTEPLDVITAAAPLDMEMDLDFGDSQRIEVAVASGMLVIERDANKITFGEVEAPLQMDEARLRLRILVDRGSVEVFVQEGQVAISRGFQLGRAPVSIELTARGGRAKLLQASVYEIEVEPHDGTAE